ncbi:hypothetical protein [Vibrio phage Va2]|nr:hypothetical protein [Vibrio phage Va2]
MAGVILSLGDLHIGHEVAAKMRGFDSVEEHDLAVMQSIVDWVGPRDVLVLTGDIVFRGAEVEVKVHGENKTKKVKLSRIEYFDYLWEKLFKKKYGDVPNITVKVTPGNHDRIEELLQSKYITKVQNYLVYKYEGKKVVFSHVPIHPDSLDRWDVNGHGHLHSKKITNSIYCNTCWEMKRRPLLLSEVAGGMFWN